MKCLVLAIFAVALTAAAQQPQPAPSPAARTQPANLPTEAEISAQGQITLAQMDALRTRLAGVTEFQQYLQLEQRYDQLQRQYQSLHRPADPIDHSTPVAKTPEKH